MENRIPIWVEYAKLGVAALTPIVTGIVGWIVLQLGISIEESKQLNQQLIGKRLSFYAEVAPQINDIYCFFQGVGNWASLNPEEMIKRKRTLDASFRINRFLFDKELFESYNHFILAHFDEFGGGPGKSAPLKLDLAHLRVMVGNNANDWVNSTEPGGHSAKQQAAAYEAVMLVLSNQIKATK
jgi:hypothetical protein